jgi:CHAT domain-containing protein/tetratricopeptide (TPR) repeat protein
MKYFICLFCLIFNSVIAQKANTETKSTYKLALSYFNADNPTVATDQKALELFKTLIKTKINTKQDAEFVAFSHEKAGVLEEVFNKVNEAKFHYFSSLNIIRIQKLTDSLSFGSMLYLSGIYFKTAQYDSCLHYLTLAENIYYKYPNVKEAERLFNTKGVLLFESGNFRESLMYFKKAESFKGTDEFSNRNNQALALQFLNKPAETLTILQKLEKDFPLEASIKINIASALLELKKPTEALFHLNKIPAVKKDLNFYNTIGKAYFQLNDFVLSRRNFELAKSQMSFKNKGIDQSITAYYLGLLANIEQNPKLALNYFQASLQKMDYFFNSNNIFENPKADFGDFNSFMLLEVLHEKSLCFKKIYFQNSQSQYLTATLESFDAMKNAAIGITKSYNNDNARIDLLAKIYPKFQEYTAFLYQIFLKTGDENYAHKAFEIGEEAKAIVLDIRISESKLKVKSGLPNDLLTKEKNLIISLNALKRNLENKTTAEQKVLLKAITETEIKLSKLKSQLEKNTSYKKSKYAQNSTISLSEIRRNIKSNELIISYVDLKDKIILFAVSKDEFASKLLQNKKSLLSLISNLKNDSRNGVISLVNNGVYKEIIGPFEKLLEGKKDIIFIPEGESNGLPMETLKDNTGKYLIQDFSVAYVFSAKFLISQNSELKNTSVLAFAPFAEKQSASFLANSESEINAIGASKTFLNASANKANFLKNYENFGILHLATHAVSNLDEPENSYFRFYNKGNADNKYFLYEFFPGQLKNTSLVFLSACDTFGDSFIGGEGVRGLSKGFYLAGSESIISSLWKAEDFSTSYISTSFYKYLQKGNSFERSLQLAKIDFLNDPEMAQFHSPKYWAHLIFVGHQVTGNSINWLKILLIFTIAITAFLIVKKSKFKF